MKKAKQIFGAHPIAWTLALLALVLCVGVGIYYAPALKLTATVPPAAQETTAAVGEAIPVGGEVELAKQAGRTLTLDTEQMILTLRDDATGQTWTSGLKDAANGSEKALLVLSYLGNDNNLQQWNTYDNCVAFGTYQLYRLANGVRVVMNVNEGESQAFYEYLPQRMPIDRYENWMLPALKQAAADGVISESDAAKYKRTLSMMYKKNVGEGCYIVAYAGNPPVSAVTQMIQMVQAVGYTRELLIEDCAVFGVTPRFHEAPEFEVTAEFTLDEQGDLVACLPTWEAVTLNDAYRVQRMALMPNFGCVAFSAEMDGYVLVPDGAGALMRFNTYNATVPDYVRPFYENDFYQDYYFQPEYAQELLMPVYGMLYGGENPTGGLLAIVEQGAETANLHVSLASSTGSGAAYNRAYVSVDALDYAKVRIYGPYDDNAATYLADTGLISLPFTVRYRPYAHGVTYYDLAVDYRHYLAAQSDTEVQTPKGSGVYLEAVGAVPLTERVLGIPYDATRSMTSYKELAALLEALPEGRLTVQYDGMFNGGMLSALNDGARLVADNGSRQELAQLQELARERDIPLFCQVNLSRVALPGCTFIPSFHALRDFANEPATLYRYTPTRGIFNGKWGSSRFEYVLSPRYFPDVTARFLAEAEGFDALAIGDLAHDFYADYRYREVLNPMMGAALARQSLEQMANQKRLALNNPQAPYAPLGEYAVNLSRESSDYASFYATVPFRQLALYGLTELTTEDANLNSRSLKYYLLQAAELGSQVKFTITAKRPDVLKSSHFEYLYAVWFEQWEADIRQAMEACGELSTLTGGQSITGHRLLAPGVTETTYENGVKILCNYNSLPYETEEGPVDALGYRVSREGGEP